MHWCNWVFKVYWPVQGERYDRIANYVAIRNTCPTATSISVSIRDCAIPNFATLLLTTHLLAVGSNKRTLSMHFAGSILTLVDVSVGKGPNTIAFYIIIFELPNQRLLDLGEKGVYFSYTHGTSNSWARIYPSAPAH